MAWAQDSTTTDSTSPADAGTPPTGQEAEEAEAPDVSIPGGEILVTGQRSRNVQRYAPQVVSVLSNEEIARTGEGDIAGALGRVTGLSVVGNGYVYVRGLGDRYSLALLNGSPLPSPEPLKRVVPLDLFPTSIIASSLVQKSYSANFPGEFGGGVINLTTRAVPDKPFLTIGGGASWDTETTNKLGYTYYGSKTDWTGYDNGNRNKSVEMKDYLSSGTLLDGTSDEARAIGSTLINGRNAVVQKDEHLPVNFSGSLSAGTYADIGEVRLGVIAAASYSNKLQTKDITTQRIAGLDYDTREQDFQQVVTENRIVANAMLGLGLEWGENKIRWTNVYIHDTVKRASLSLGYQNATPTIDYMYQDTGWYERQLMDTQLVGEFKLGSDTELDVRGGYANSKRKAPYEISLQYVRLNSGTNGDQFINRLDGGNQGDATVDFSNLDEDVWSAGADLSHTFGAGWQGTVGYAYQLNDRRTSRRAFQIRAQGDTRLISTFGLLRPDVLFQPGMFYIDQATDNAVDYHLLTNEIDYAGAVFDANDHVLARHPVRGRGADRRHRHGHPRHQPRARILAARPDAYLRAAARHAAARQRFEDDRTPAVPRAAVSNLLRPRQQPQLSRQPAANGQPALQRRSALRVLSEHEGQGVHRRLLQASGKPDRNVPGPPGQRLRDDVCQRAFGQPLRR
ncbi:MAG: TonB-dependent receptor plug domain-containing protein [Micrococcales bacterium]|nr:TonB-dependent receptor plug domain-containing protein [Micrococcales bacterium]